MITDLATHDTQYVTPAELAAYWQLDASSIYRWIDKGALPAERIGPKLWRIKTVDARTFGRPPAYDAPLNGH